MSLSEDDLRRWRDLERDRLAATLDEDARLESVRTINILNAVLQED
jgi:hypothetical protein